MRALRLLHRDLSDLCDTRQRAGFAARAHLPDQGHAREFAAGRRADRHPYRPLPVLPRLHDNLPVGRQLHAPRRPRPRAYPEDLYAPAGRPLHPVAACLRAAEARPLPVGAQAGAARQAVCRPVRAHDTAEASGRDAEARAGRRAAEIADLASWQSFRRGRVARPRRHPYRLRPAGARPRHQRGGDFIADQARHRRRRAQGRGLLRRAGASHGPRGAGTRFGAP